MPYVLLKFLLIIACCLVSSIASAQAAKNNILIIHSYHSEHEWTKMLKDGYESAFKLDTNTRLLHEFMDNKRYPKGTFKKQFLAYLQEKYANTPIDILVVTDNSALNWVNANRAVFLPLVPIVYSGINQVTPEILALKNSTGVFENRDLAQTVFDIKAMTKQNNLLVVSDSSITGKINSSKIYDIYNHPNAPEHIYLIEDLTENSIVSVINSYPQKTPILVIGQLIDPKQHNGLLSWHITSQLLANYASGPIFTIAQASLQNGATGADELDGVQHAMQASKLVKLLLNNTEIDKVKPILNAQTTWMLDAQLLKEFEIAKVDIPKPHTLINEDATFYQKYKLYVWVIIAAFTISLCIIAMMAEIIRRGRQTQKLLNINKERYKDLAHAGANIFWETNTQDKLCYISGDTQLFFYLPQQNMLGQSLLSLMKNNPHIEFPVNDYQQAQDAFQPLDNLIFKVKPTNQDLKILMLIAKPIYASNNSFTGYRGIIKDITQQHRLSEQVAYAAAYDQLTGLMNRHTFNQHLKKHLPTKSNDQVHSFLCMLDLDRFKLVNDSAGHLVGDAMLCEVTTLIMQSINKGDLLARLGGDEFALVINASNLPHAQLTCEKIINAVKGYKFTWNERIFDTGISIGMVPISYGLNATELLSMADIACYKAKELGRGRVFITDQNNNNLFNEALQIGYIANISQAIANKQFFLVKQLIQPLYKNPNAQPHYEILIRFKALDGTLIPPDLFIPAAEKNGLITLIDHWVISTLLLNYHAFFPQGDTLVSINLSGISLSDEQFVQQLIKLVKSSDVPAHNICFEITETAAISQIFKVQKFIAEMKTLGIKFALDDFGSGASTFEYLKNLPADYLKIDGSLIKNIERSEIDQEIVKSINAIAHMMGMQTIAEFVENEQINNILYEIGINYAQGYQFGKPCPCDPSLLTG